MNQWQAEIKPPPQICPQEYCFHWVKAGGHFSSGFHESIEEAWLEAKPVMIGTCSITSTFGHCARAGQKSNVGDFYEPNEPTLSNDGLPWFYFIPSPTLLVPESYDEYIRESEILWGKKHWRSTQDE